jgi:hypothetical protein
VIRRRFPVGANPTRPNRSILGRPVAEKALHGMNAHGAVQSAAIAACLAGVMADAAVHGGQRVVLHQLQPRFLETARLGQRQQACTSSPAGQALLQGASRLT